MRQAEREIFVVLITPLSADICWVLRTQWCTSWLPAVSTLCATCDTAAVLYQVLCYFLHDSFLSLLFSDSWGFMTWVQHHRHQSENFSRCFSSSIIDSNSFFLWICAGFAFIFLMDRIYIRDHYLLTVNQSRCCIFFLKLFKDSIQKHKKKSTLCF